MVTPDPDFVDAEIRNFPPVEMCIWRGARTDSTHSIKCRGNKRRGFQITATHPEPVAGAPGNTVMVSVRGCGSAYLPNRGFSLFDQRFFAENDDELILFAVAGNLDPVRVARLAFRLDKEQRMLPRF